MSGAATRRPRALKTEQFKQEAVIALCTQQGPAEAIAQDLGVCRVSLYNWKNQLLGKEGLATMKRQSKPPSDPDSAELERQIAELKGTCTAFRSSTTC